MTIGLISHAAGKIAGNQAGRVPELRSQRSETRFRK